MIDGDYIMGTEESGALGATEGGRKSTHNKILFELSNLMIANGHTVQKLYCNLDSFLQNYVENLLVISLGIILEFILVST